MQPQLDAWIAAFRPRAWAQGISDGVLDAAFAGVHYDADVIERDRNQPEYDLSIRQYLDRVITEKRVSNGRAALRQHGPLLAEIEARYGVDAEVVAAVWGMESSYGEIRGDFPLIRSLTTLSFDGRRGRFFESQLIAALKILQAGDVTPARMTGSWAGAMGHTQFIPTSYLAYAQDFRGDGRRDIWSDDPTDALASTAAYLRNFGWRQGQPWGVEVVLPEGFNRGLAGSRKSVAEWRALGIRGADGDIPEAGSATLKLPGDGLAVLAFRNWTAIERYNAADAYVIGVGHLSDRLKGGGPFRAMSR